MGNFVESLKHGKSSSWIVGALVGLLFLFLLIAVILVLLT